MYKKIILLTTSMALLGCAHKQPEPSEQIVRVEEVIKERKIIIDTACDWVRPIYVHSTDTLTPGTARQILAHNETWESICQKTTK